MLDKNKLMLFFFLCAPRLICSCDLETFDMCFKVNHSFSDYKAERGEKPLMLLFPGGRELSNPEDERADQQKHEGFYTLDIDDRNKINPHVKGDLFSEEVWAEIEDTSFDVVHVENPGALFLYDVTDSKRQEKDAYILRKVSEKIKNGGKLFVDLRYSRFWPMPSSNIPTTVSEAKKKMNESQVADCDFFVDVSFSFNNEHRASFWSHLIDEDKDEILDILNKNNQNGVYCGDREKLEFLEEATSRKLDELDEEAEFGCVRPYVIYFDKETRDHIFAQYDDLFGQYGFKRSQPVVELYGKMNANVPFDPPLKRAGDFILYKGMCFFETIAEYEKI